VTPPIPPYPLEEEHFPRDYFSGIPPFPQSFYSPSPIVKEGEPASLPTCHSLESSSAFEAKVQVNGKGGIAEWVQ
jgi:hypothetical protein